MLRPHRPEKLFSLMHLQGSGERRDLAPIYAIERVAMARWSKILTELRAEQAAGRSSGGGTLQLIDARTGRVVVEDTI